MPNELNLNNKPNEVLKVTIGDTTYDIPLASSLPYKKVKALIKITKQKDDEQIESFVDFFKQYIPEEVIEELSMSALTDLAKAWSRVSNQDEKLGE